jgi:hypothetical protein
LIFGNKHLERQLVNPNETQFRSSLICLKNGSKEVPYLLHANLLSVLAFRVKVLIFKKLRRLYLIWNLSVVLSYFSFLILLRGFSLVITSDVDLNDFVSNSDTVSDTGPKTLTRNFHESASHCFHLFSGNCTTEETFGKRKNRVVDPDELKTDPAF